MGVYIHDGWYECDSDYESIHTLFESLPQNTADEPYDIQINDLDSALSTVTHLMKYNPTIYVNLSRSKLSLTNLDSAFSGIPHLVIAPVIDNNCASMNRCFSYCGNLKVIPRIPCYLTDFEYIFQGCTNLEEISEWEISDESFSIMKSTAIYAFDGTNTNLTIYAYDSEKKISNYTAKYKLIDFLFHKAQRIGGFEDIVKNLETRIGFYELDLWLQHQEKNDLDSPYEINVIDITDEALDPVNKNSFNFILNRYKNIYIGMSETVLSKADGIYHASFNGLKTLITPPQFINAIELSGTFENCSNLIVFPTLYEGVKNIDNICSNCQKITEIGTLPDSIETMLGSFQGTGISHINNIPSTVTNLYYTFANCKNLESTPTIPESVTEMVGTFYGTAIITIPNIPKNLVDLTGCFGNCKNLTHIPAIPSSVSSLNQTFEYCTSMIQSPKLPNNNELVIAGIFAGCENLEVITNIPSGAMALWHSFADCPKLTKINKWEIEPSSPILNISSSGEGINTYDAYDEIFINSSIQEIIVNGPYEELLLEKALKDIEVHTSSFPFNINSTVKADTNEIPYVNFEEWISMVSEVPPMIPYKINITEIPVEALAISIIDGAIRCPLGYTIEQYPYKYLDLRDTQLPVIDGLMYAFNNCKALMYPPKLPDGVRSLTNTFANCINLQQQPDLPNGITNMNSTFEGCEDLYEITGIPDSVTSMMQCFMNCTNLRKISNIPVNVKDLSLTFSGCSNLTEISLWEATDFTGTEFDFYLCDKLTDIFTEDVEMEIKVEKSIYKAFENKFSASDIQGSLGNMKQIVKAINTDIPFRILSTWILWQDHNDIDHPYKIKVTELTQADLAAKYYHSPLANVLYAGIGDLIEESEVLRHEINVYLDMSETELPDGIISLANCFTDCENLVAAPAIPNTVIDLYESFSRCYALKEIPEIPQPMKDGFEIPVDLGGTFNHCSMIKTSPKLPRASNTSGCFYGCTSLETVKNVPVVEMTDIGSEGSGEAEPMFVRDLSYMFEGCSNLVTIEKWEMPLEMMIGANMDECFSGCTSLENIYVDRLTPIVNATPNNWTFYRIKNDVANHNLIVSKYEKVENTGRSSSPYKIWSTEVPYIPGDKIYLEYGADEIAYLPNPSEQEIEDLDAAIDKYFKTQSRFVTKGITQALDPENSNFVIWAKDPNSVKCNFLDVSVSMTDRDFDDVFEE
ncbi:MAG: leucine-rich repeat domain-containing protein [Bacilli bacterium]|nr:leucine-rich repeat domain-containing protein [Bacilli bacterium]